MSDQPVSRRDAVRTVGAAAAGLAVGSALASPGTAEGADGSSLVLGSTANTATSRTALNNSGAISDINQPVGALEIRAANADYGVYATASDFGVGGSAVVGVYGVGSVGALFSGSEAAVNLDPATTSGPPLGPFNSKGDIVVDADGVLWLCVADAAGTPGSQGTWIRVSHGGTRLFSAPVRAYSSTDDARGALKRGETRTIGITSAIAPTTLPANALGIVGNLTVHTTQVGGYVTAWPAGTPQPPTSNINWSGSGLAIANSLTVKLGTGGAINLFADALVASGDPATHVIVDVVGYIL